MPYKDAKRNSSANTGTYDIYIEIDCDCEELLQACDIEYDQCEDDDTQLVKDCAQLYKEMYQQEAVGLFTTATPMEFI